MRRPMSAQFSGKSTFVQNRKTYDGIIIGAGHHGLILGSYLARAGLDILLVDRRLTYGGGLCTREVTLPGFYHNLHSINHFHISETPWFKDLNLDERVTYVTPRYEFGQAHHDGSALVLGRDLEESVANIARFSKKDAATFREWNRKAEKITRRFSGRNAMPSHCRKRSANRCCHARHWGASFSKCRTASRSMSYANCSITNMCDFCFCSRSHYSAPGWWIRCQRPRPWARSFAPSIWTVAISSVRAALSTWRAD